MRRTPDLLGEESLNADPLCTLHVSFANETLRRSGGDPICKGECEERSPSGTRSETLGEANTSTDGSFERDGDPGGAPINEELLKFLVTSRFEASRSMPPALSSSRNEHAAATSGFCTQGCCSTSSAVRRER